MSKECEYEVGIQTPHPVSLESLVQFLQVATRQEAFPIEVLWARAEDGEKYPEVEPELRYFSDYGVADDDAIAFVEVMEKMARSLRDLAPERLGSIDIDITLAVSELVDNVRVTEERKVKRVVLARTLAGRTGTGLVEAATGRLVGPGESLGADESVYDPQTEH
jgi:hypothetical protein